MFPGRFYKNRINEQFICAILLETLRQIKTRTVFSGRTLSSRFYNIIGNCGSYYIRGSALARDMLYNIQERKNVYSGN